MTSYWNGLWSMEEVAEEHEDVRHELRDVVGGGVDEGAQPQHPGVAEDQKSSLAVLFTLLNSCWLICSFLLFVLGLAVRYVFDHPVPKLFLERRNTSLKSSHGSY